MGVTGVIHIQYTLFLVRARLRFRVGHRASLGVVKVNCKRGIGSSTLSLTSSLCGVGGQHHAQAAVPLGQTLYPFYRRVGGPQGQSGWARKILPPLGFDT